MSKTTLKFKQKFFVKGKTKCTYCGIKLILHNCVVDHIMPKSKGGDNSISNLCFSCAKCNNHKWDYTIDDWRIRLKEKVSDLNRQHKYFSKILKVINSNG